MITPSWHSYFYFTKKELKGIIVLGCILLGSILVGKLFSSKQNKENLANRGASIPLTDFDPNQMDSTYAISIGIPEKQVRSLMHYRQKGGYFKTPADFSKLYGLDNALFIRLSPFIKIAHTNNRPIPIYSNQFKKYDYATSKEDWKIEINKADENEWHAKTKIPMLLIHRIIAYKNYVGAFENTHQLSKVYGFDDSLLYELKGHFYIDKSTKMLLNANAMNFNDWKHLGLFTDPQIWKLLRLKKENQGKVGWAFVVEAFDLTEAEAMKLKQKVRFTE